MTRDFCSSSRPIASRDTPIIRRIRAFINGRIPSSNWAHHGEEADVALKEVVDNGAALV
ncbi:MAG: hypothetical protein QXS20_04385 [Candidatus Thorarchaeota archaeon]